MKKISLTFFTTFLLILVLFSGCNEKDSNLNTITIDGPDGTSITFPDDSSNSDIIFTIEEVDKSLVTNLPEYFDEVICLYDFSANKELDEPVKINIPIPDAELASLGHYHNNKWTILSFEEENGNAIVEVHNFSWFGWLKISDLKGKILNAISLDWADPEPELIYDSNFEIDNSECYGLIDGSAVLLDENKVEITIINKAPVHLKANPSAKYIGKDFDLKRTTIFAYEDYVVIDPKTVAKWTTDLDVGESVTFEAVFDDAAVYIWFEGIVPLPKIPPTKLFRGIIESHYFRSNGRTMKWSDVKGLLILPEIADAFKTLDDMEDTPNLHETAKITIKRVKSSDPTLNEQDTIKEEFEQWLYDNRYNLSDYGGFGYPIDLEVNHVDFIDDHIWVAASYPGPGVYGHIFHSFDMGENWKIKWKCGTYGPDPFEIIFLDQTEGFVGTDDAVLHTTDQGNSWDEIWERSAFGNRIRDIEIINENKIKCLTSRNNVFYLVTEDNGVDWEVENI